jgi:hypothetical protein
LVRTALVGLLLLASGCGPKVLPPVPKPYPVRGKVLLPGNQPLRGGVVTFRPVGDAPDRRYQGFGFPKPDGTFEITSFRAGDGVAPGLYKVTIGPREEGELRGSNAGAVPKKYQSETTTPLTIEVKAEENSLAPFVLQ